MSMLSVQCKTLRKVAYEVERIKHNNADWIWRDGITLMDAAREMRDAADTIAELRLRCQELQEKEWRTCHLVTESTDARDWPNNQRCDHCGEYVAVVSPERVNFCPSCGKRIVP